MKQAKCAFCNPKKIEWEEDGFYSSRCSVCTDGKTVFIVSSDHKGILSEEEKIQFNKLVEKHYPGFVPKEMDKKRSLFHWYEFLIKKD